MPRTNPPWEIKRELHVKAEDETNQSMGIAQLKDHQKSTSETAS